MADLASRHALGIDTYDMYCGHASSLVALDTDKLVDALLRLINSADLRKGRRTRRLRARQTDWKKIIPQYEALWGELRQIRESHNVKAKTAEIEYGWPARLDPTIGFKEYPTRHLTLDTMFELNTKPIERLKSQFTTYTKLAMVNYEKYVTPTSEELEIVLTIREEEKWR